MRQKQQAGLYQQSCRGGTDHASRSGYHSSARGGASSSPSTCKVIALLLWLSSSPHQSCSHATAPHHQRPAAKLAEEVVLQVVAQAGRKLAAAIYAEAGGQRRAQRGQERVPLALRHNFLRVAAATIFWYCPLLPADLFNYKKPQQAPASCSTLQRRHCPALARARRRCWPAGASLGTAPAHRPCPGSLGLVCACPAADRQQSCGSLTSTSDGLKAAPKPIRTFLLPIRTSRPVGRASNIHTEAAARTESRKPAKCPAGLQAPAFAWVRTPAIYLNKYIC